MHPMLSIQDKLFNVAGYVPLIGSVSGSIRIYFALNTIAHAGKNLFRTDLTLKNKIKLFVPGINDLVRGSIEIVPFAGLALIIYDLAKAKILYWAPVEVAVTKRFDDVLIPLGHDFNLAEAYFLTKEVERQSTEILSTHSGITSNGIHFDNSFFNVRILQIDSDIKNPLTNYGFHHSEIPILLNSYISQKTPCENLAPILQSRPAYVGKLNLPEMLSTFN